MGLCKKCNTVKNTELFNGEQICEDCLSSNNIVEEVLKKKQYKIKNNNEQEVWGSIIIGFIFFLLFIGIFYIITSKSNEENKLPKEIIEAEKSIKIIPKNDIFENYKIYELLSSFYKNNISYKEQFERYKKLEKLSNDCFMKATSINREYALNKNTYNVNSFLGDNKTTMINDETIIKKIEFSVKNDFGMEINYISEYECKLDGSIRQILMFRK